MRTIGIHKHAVSAKMKEQLDATTIDKGNRHRTIIKPTNINLKM
jgi:hypothetical protein